MKRDKTGKFTYAWNQESKRAVKLSLTNTAWQLLEQQARESGISRSELVERQARHVQCRCCIKHNINLSNGKFSSTRAARAILKTAPHHEEPSAEQVSVLQHQNAQLQKRVAELEQEMEELRSQERRFQQIIDAIPHMVWTCQPNGENEYFNQQTLDALGITLEDILTKGWHALVHPDDLQPTLDAWTTAVATGSSCQAEYRLRMADGSYRWHLAQAHPQRDEAGRVKRWFGTCTEIDDRKRLEQQLQQQVEAQNSERQWLNAVLNLLPTPLMMVDPEQMRVSFSNRAANAIAGVDLAQDVGATYDERYYCTDANGQVLPPDQVPAVRAARGEHIKGMEVTWHTPAGVFPLLVDANTIPAMHNHPATSVVVFQNIQERKQIEEQLRESQWFIQRVAGAVPGMLYIYDLIEQRNIYSNQQVGDVLGYSIEEIQEMGDRLFPLLMHPDDLATLPKHTQRFQTAQDGEVIELEYRMRHSNGEWRWLWSRDLIFSRTETGAAHQILGISHDITDRKQAELSLQQTEERLQLALTSAKMVVWDMDLQTDQVVCSSNASEIWGVQTGTAEDFFARVHPEDRQRLIDALEQAKLSKNHYFQEYRVIHPNQVVRWLSSQGRIYFNAEGQMSRMVGVSIDISDRKRAEMAIAQSVDRTARLQSITAALSEALTPIDVATVIMDQALAALGACRGLVALLNHDKETLSLIRAVGYAPNTLSGWESFSVNANVPLAHAVRTQTPIFFRSLEEMIASFPPLQPLKAHLPVGAIAIIPLVAENQALGSLAIGFTEAHLISETDQAFALTLGRQCAQAIRRAQLYQAEQAARAEAEASEQRFRFLAESIPQMVWVARANGFTEYYNRRWFEYTGLTLEESQNANGSFRHPDDNADFIAAWIHAVTNKQTFQAEQRIRRADGVYRWHLSRAYPQLDENGEIVKWFGSCTDIDDWKRMEQTQRFLAQASQTFAAARLDLQTILDTVTRLISELMGDVCVLNLLSSDRQSLEHVSFYHSDPEIRAFVEELLEQHPHRVDEGISGQVLQTGEPLLMPVTSQDEFSAAIKPEYRLYLERFQVCSTLLLPLKVQGQPIGVLSLTRHAPADPHSQEDLSVVQDLADRAAMAIANAELYQQAEQARQWAERNAERTARLQAVTAALSESLTPAQVADVIAQQTRWAINAASVLVALVTPDDELEIIHYLGDKGDVTPEWRRFPISVATPLTDAVRSGQPMWEESLEKRIARYPHLAEAYRRTDYCTWISLPLMVEGQAVGGMSVTFAEFSRLEPEDRAFILSLAQQCAQAIARAQLYEAEQRARAQAEAANRMKDEFLAVLSHELRTPMNPILGWSRLLQQGNLDAKRTAIALETIERNAKLQVQLIEDLLDVSRILQGKLSLNSAPVDLVSTINDAIETVRLAAEAKNIQIQTQFQIGIGYVLGDSARLQQVAWNLLSNAVKFTPTDGHVEIKLETVRTQTTEPSALAPIHNAKITVTDTGKGISAEFLPHVFDTFRQADSSITRSFGGLGLGLAITRHIVELHGGTIQAASLGDGKGATFTVTLPLVQSSSAVAQEEVISNSSTLQGVQILAVDDESDNLELVTFILEQAGASVVAVSSAQAALQSFRQARPDLLLADIGMPQMNGYALLGQIRSLEAKQGDRPIPAIALTAYAGEVDQQRALAAGFQHHLPKPVEPKMLLQAILDCVKQQENHNQN